MSSSGRKKPQKRKDVNQQLTKERMPIKGFMKDTLRVCRQGKADQEGKQNGGWHNWTVQQVLQTAKSFYAASGLYT